MNVYILKQLRLLTVKVSFNCTVHIVFLWIRYNDSWTHERIWKFNQKTDVKKKYRKNIDHFSRICDIFGFDFNNLAWIGHISADVHPNRWASSWRWYVWGHGCCLKSRLMFIVNIFFSIDNLLTINFIWLIYVCIA